MTLQVEVSQQVTAPLLCLPGTPVFCHGKRGQCDHLTTTVASPLQFMTTRSLSASYINMSSGMPKQYTTHINRPGSYISMGHWYLA